MSTSTEPSLTVTHDRRAPLRATLAPWRGPESGLVTQRLMLLKTMLLVSDLMVLLSALAMASVLRFGTRWLDSWNRQLPGWQAMLALYLAVVLGAFWLGGLYRIRSNWSLRAEIVDLLRIAGLVALATLGSLYIFRLPEISRVFVLCFFGFSAAGLISSRMAVRRSFRWLRARGQRLRHVLVVGSGPSAEYFVTRMAANPELGVRVVGYASDDRRRVHEYPLLGNIKDVPELLTGHVIDEVAICLPLREWQHVDPIVKVAEEQGKAVRIPVDLLSSVAGRGRLEQLDGLPILSIVSTPDHTPAHGMKRLIDLVCTLLGLIALVPVLSLVALAVLVSDGRPILFSQTRVGLHARPFRIHKFRTMVRDAERRQPEVIHLNERAGPAFKARNDPRITPLGRWLRRTSLDELPQLWNVLVGEMSLVGPRPPLTHEVARYDPWHRRRLSMKPGMTGLWQITARGDPGFDSWVEADLCYIDNWSLLEDLAILARTVPAVLRVPGI